MPQSSPVITLSTWDAEKDEVVIKVTPEGYKVAFITENADGSTYITLAGPNAVSKS